jgi:transposase
VGRRIRVKEKIARLKQEMSRLEVIDTQMRNTPDQQISLTDPDARSMATSGRGSGFVGYNVQVAVDTEHHLIITHEVINVGNDRGQLVRMSKQAKEVLEVDKLEAVADRDAAQSPLGQPGPLRLEGTSAGPGGPAAGA